MRTERRLVATLSCHCTVAYPRGVPARRGEHVWCSRHGAAETTRVTTVTTDETTARRERRARSNGAQP